jgi:hypothetical protein
LVLQLIYQPASLGAERWPHNLNLALMNYLMFMLQWCLMMFIIIDVIGPFCYEFINGLNTE